MLIITPLLIRAVVTATACTVATQITTHVVNELLGDTNE